MARRVFENKIVRYFFSAGIATGVDVFVYFISFNFILRKHDIPLFDPIIITAPIGSLAISYTCGLLTNFLITKYHVFTDSDLRGRHQLMRYLLVALLILFLNYLLMKLFVEVFNWYPTISRVISALSVGVLSFIIHKFYSFRVTSK